MEWLTWMEIRGPIGPQRHDFYASYVAMHAGGPYEKEVQLADFEMPWIKPDDES